MSKILLSSMPNEYKDLYDFLNNNYYYSNHKYLIFNLEKENIKIKIEYFKNLNDIKINVYSNNILTAKINYIRCGFSNKVMYLENLKNNENFFNIKFINNIFKIFKNELEYLQNIKFSDIEILNAIGKISEDDF